MASAIACRPVPGAASSRPAATRVGSASLPEYESLESPREFRRVLKDGTRRRSGGVVMVKCPGAPGAPRVGLVVSKSAGNAVTRNRIKRRLRHALRVVQLKPGTDYVLIAASQVADAPHPQLMGWLERVLEDGDV